MAENEIPVPKQGQVVAATPVTERPRRRRQFKSNHFHISRKNRQLSRNILLIVLFVLAILILWYVMVSGSSV